MVTKVKKCFLKKKERIKDFFIFLTMLSFKQVKSSYGKKDPPANKLVVGLLSFLIV